MVALRDKAHGMNSIDLGRRSVRSKNATSNQGHRY